MCNRASSEQNEVYEGLLERQNGGEFGYNESERPGGEGIECK